MHSSVLLESFSFKAETSVLNWHWTDFFPLWTTIFRYLTPFWKTNLRTIYLKPQVVHLRGRGRWGTGWIQTLFYVIYNFKELKRSLKDGGRWLKGPQKRIYLTLGNRVGSHHGSWGGLFIFSLYLVLVYLFVKSYSEFAFFFNVHDNTIFANSELMRDRIIWSPGALSPVYSYKLLRRPSLVLPTANRTA